MIGSGVGSRGQADRRRTIARRVVWRIDSRTGLHLTPRLQSVERRLQRWRSAARSGAAGGSLGHRVTKIESAQFTLDGEVRALKLAIAELRGLGGRVSELTDLVTELLIVSARAENPEFAALVDKYLKGI